MEMTGARARSVSGVAAMLAALCLALAATAQAGTVASPPKGATKTPSKKHHAISPPVLTLGPGLLAGPAVGVTMAPVGLSLEYPVIVSDLGTGPCPPGALTSELLRLGSPPIELAGVSQDFTAPAEAAPVSPSSWEGLSTYTLPASFWSQLHCLLSATHDPLTVGLNARIGLPSWAAQMVAGAQSAATNGLSFSLGNEPDLYELPDYASLDKPQPGEEAIDVHRYLQVAESLKPELAGEPVIGPEISGPHNWEASLPHVIQALGAATVGVHAYPLSVCLTPRAATIGGLLDPSIGNEPESFSWVVADATAAGVPAIISEANSVSCGGKAGVSDSPAAAVWAVRFVLAALKTGFREVRFHFSGDPYDPFVMHGSELLERPLESALVALNQWLPAGSTVRTVKGPKGLVATALQTPAGAVTLILDNEQTVAQPLELKGARTLEVQQLSPLHAGLQTVALAGLHELFKLNLPANTVAALTWTPGA